VSKNFIYNSKPNPGQEIARRGGTAPSGSFEAMEPTFG